LKAISTILICLLCSLSCFGQAHYPLNNFLEAVAHPWDITPGIGVYKNHDLLFERTQSSIISLKLTGLRLYNDVYASRDSLTYRLSPEGRGFQTDEGILSLKSKKPGFDILYCWQGMPTAFQNEWNAAGVKSTTYRRYASDPSSSLSYTDIAHDCYVLTSRGGRNKNVPDYPLFVAEWWAPAQVMYKGAGIYDAIEGGNEWDNRWSNDRPMTGTQYAIAWSPTYDSIKKADPSMQVSTTGLCEADPKTLIDAWAWVNQNRGGKFPADMIQVHSYPWSWYRGLSGGSPGEFSIIPEVKKMIDAAKGIPVIVGEWSWDVNRDSPINAPAFDNYTAEKSRALLAIRTIIKFSQIGVYKSYWYRINQDYFTGDPLGGNFANDNNGTQFATSALRRQVDDSGQYVKTTVGDYFGQLTQFGDYSYKDSEADNDSLQIHRLADPIGRVAFALWAPEIITSWTDWKGVSHPEFTQRRIKHTLPTGTIYRFSDDSSGVMTQEHIAAGPVEINSKPFFFVADPAPTPLPVKIITFTVQKIQQSAVIKYAVQDAAKVEVERSADGRTWTNLGEGIFNNVIDRSPSPGRNYYRLKMYEQDGSFSYSFIRTLQFDHGKNERVMMVNSIGQVLKQGYNQDVERWKAELKHGTWPMGVYYFRYENNTEPFLKQ
jgi:hypothetical protein